MNVHTYWRAVNDSNEEASETNATGNLPVWEMGKSVLNDAIDDSGERYAGAYPQDKQHQEEEHGEQLRDHGEFRQGFRIGDKS